MRGITIILKLVNVNVLMNVDVLQISYGGHILLVLVLVEFLGSASAINTLTRKLVDVSHSLHVIAANSVVVEEEVDTLEDSQEVKVDILEDSLEEVEDTLVDSQEAVVDTLEDTHILLQEAKILVGLSLHQITAMKQLYLVEEVEETD